MPERSASSLSPAGTSSNQVRPRRTPEPRRTPRTPPNPLREPLLQPLRQAGGMRSAAANDQNRIVTCDRADDFGQTGSIDRHGERLRLSCVGPEHDQLIDDVVAAEVVVNRGPAFDFGIDRRLGPGSGASIRPVRCPFDQSQIANIARQGGLRDLDCPQAAQSLAQLFLAGDSLAIDDLQDRRLSNGLHNYARTRHNYTCFRLAVSPV